MAKKLTQEQKARIYCVKNGHANYVFKCWGYVHCGRCGEQIGDQLGGVFDTRDLLVVGCKTKGCKVCPKVKKTLSKMDKEILKRLTKYPDRIHKAILEGIKFT